MNTDALFSLTHGIYILSAKDGSRLVGSAIDAVMQVANKPLVIAVSCHNGSFTKECIEKNSEFALSVIGKKIDPFIVANFGFQTSRTANKWDDTKYQLFHELPIVENCIAKLYAKVIKTEKFESNTLFLAEVLDCANIQADEPLTYLDYRTYFKNEVLKFLPQILNKKGEQK